MNSDSGKSKILNIFNKKNSKTIKSELDNLDNNNYNSASKNNSKNDLLFINQKKFLNIDCLKKKNSINILGYSSPIEEEIEKISEELELPKRHRIEIDNKKLIFQTDIDISTIDKLLQDDNIKFTKGNEIHFFDIIIFILKKINKRFAENEILKIYFLKNEKLVAMFKPLNVNINDMMRKLVSQIKYEKKLKDNILFKEGDKGDKFYIILKGEVGILIQQEKIFNCTPIEYLKYLMILFLYTEKSLISKMIYSNRDIINYDDKCFFSIMDAFKYYHFYKNFTPINTEYRDVIDFIHVEARICKFLHRKNDCSPEESFHLLEISNFLGEELYNFYIRIIENIQKVFYTEIASNLIRKETSNINNINNPANVSDFILHLKSHEQEGNKYKSEEFLEKLYNINEFSNYLIRACTVNEYIQRLNGEEILKLIRKDSKNFIVKLFEDKINYKYYNYFEVNHLKDGNIFGELALINPSKKRTATVIIKDDCHLGVLNKEAYDLSIKNAQDKLRIRNLLFFTNGPIFNGIANNFFLNNYFYRFKKKLYNSGDMLFHRGEKRNKIIFIVNGELQLSAKLTLRKVTDIIKYLIKGKSYDDGGLSKNYCKENIKFKRFYEENIKNFRLYVLKDKEIAGLDDMTENNIYLFDCKCVSLEPTEVYELEYKIFEEASEDNSVKRNNDYYVSIKKEFLLHRLYGIRDSIAKNEYNRIKAFFFNLNLDDILKNEEKKSNKINNNNNNDIKNRTLNNFYSLNNTTFKKIFQNSDDFQNINNNAIFNNTIFSNTNINNTIKNNNLNKKFPPVNYARKLSSYKEIKNKYQNQNKNYFNKVLKTDNDEINTNANNANIKILFSSKKSKNINNKNGLLLLKEKKIQSCKKNNINFKLIKNDTNNNKIRASSTRKNNYNNIIIKNNNSNNIDKIDNIDNFVSINLKNKKLIKHIKNKLMNKIIKQNKKNNMPSSKILLKEFTKIYIEPNKIPYQKRRFIFNNQKIFAPLLKNKKSIEKKFINETIKYQINNNNNKEGLLKKIIYNKSDEEIEKTESSNRKKRYTTTYTLLSSKNKKSNKYKNKMIEENYKDIFFIDCLCLDKWEEKKNKTPGKEKGKLRGKKLIQ